MKIWIVMAIYPNLKTGISGEAYRTLEEAQNFVHSRSGVHRWYNPTWCYSDDGVVYKLKEVKVND